VDYNGREQNHTLKGITQVGREQPVIPSGQTEYPTRIRVLSEPQHRLCAPDEVAGRVALSHNRGQDCGMAMTNETPKNIDDYAGRFPKEVQQLLKNMRLAIKKAAPQAKETISYGIPAFTLNGMLVWFAAFKSHIGFYPRASAIAAFKKELSAYKRAKGSVQFPFDEPLPLALVSRIVKFRVQQNLSKSKKK
jgi:uncharacterized protein YdhG (YjbR/CyaY superfamily)